MYLSLVPALSHVLEFLITFTFLNELFFYKTKKLVSSIVGILLYLVNFLTFVLFDSTLINIICYFWANILFAMLCYTCEFKGAVLSSLFLSGVNTATEFVVINFLAIFSNSDIKIYNSNVYMFLLMVLLSKTVFLLL